MPTSNIKRTNTILYCRNWEAAVRFYRNILDFEINHKTEWFVEFHLVGDTYLSIADASRASIKSAAGDGITLSWQVQDVEFAHRRLQQLGVLTRIFDILGSCRHGPDPVYGTESQCF